MIRIIMRSSFFHISERVIMLLWAFFAIPISLFGSVPTISNTQEGIELRNDLVSITISEKGELLSCVDLATKAEVADSRQYKIAYYTNEQGKNIVCSKAVLNENILSLTMGDVIVDLEICIYNRFFTVEVKNDNFPEVKSLTFLTLKLDYDYDSTSFIGAGVAMSLHIAPIYYPSGESREVAGRCTAHTGIKGAKLAIILCKKNDIRDIIKEVYSFVPKGELPISTSGGPYALDNDMIRRDCVSTKEADPNRIQEYINVFSRFGISQIDFLLGSNTFIQGQFTFPEFGSASEFKRQITNPLLDAGIISTMHTFSFYISYGANEILSNPRWQQQLEFRESYKLSNSLRVTDTQLSVLDEKKELNKLLKEKSFIDVHTPYILIDNEIVKYKVEKDGRIHIQRGQCGTVAADHKKGAKAKFIGGYYSCIAPQIGSELFYEVARRTAKAYNEGGFKGVYFDAFDGLWVHLDYMGLRECLGYYGASFVNEFISHCDESPIIEFSDLYPAIWSARGRGGAWDIPYRGYKDFIKEHTRSNKQLLGRHYITTLGWLNFYPNQTKEPWNYSTKYLYFDDVDYLGVQAIAYDQTMVYNHLKIDDIKSLPAMRRNMDHYSLYNSLRKEHYFSKNVISKLREGNYEYKLTRRGLRWGFKEAVYCRDKMCDIDLWQFNGYNPFTRQRPFIRLENMYTSDCSSLISLLSFDKNVDISEQNRKKAFSNVLDLRNNLGIKVRIKGNGLESSDAVCIRLSSLNSAGVADYVVRLDFDGWREVILTSLDNGEIPDQAFEGKEDDIHKVHRFFVDFSKINCVEVFKSVGSKVVRIDSIAAVPLKQNHLINPRLKLGSASITFNDTIESGEYIEYNVGDKTATVYDEIGNSRSVRVQRKGRFIVPKGSFTATVSGEPELKNAPSEVTLTFGLYGKFIHN